MSAAATKLERTYRRRYYWLIVGAWLIGALVFGALLFAVGGLAAMTSFVTVVDPNGSTAQAASRQHGQSIKVAPNCRPAGSRSTLRTAASGRETAAHSSAMRYSAST